MKLFNTDLDPFVERHIGTIDPASSKEMLAQVGYESMESFMDEVIPDSIKTNTPMDIGEALSQTDFLDYIANLAEKNKAFKSYIGLGYYNTFLPPVILRCLLENPGWYTQYTPYQAEISQGRLESLLNFQTVVSDLTALPVANASLLDEGTAIAEAMFMAYRIGKGKKSKVFVAEDLFPQSISILKTRAKGVGIELVVGAIDNPEKFDPKDEDYGAIIVQYPSANGEITDHRELIERCRENNILVITVADILSLTLITPPGELGADIAVGSTQRLGVPMGFGGPHAAYLTTKDEYKRFVPGRIIGVAKDKFGKTAFRMSLQTREQHIRREKANSNICTAQALLANIAAMFVVYHGREGLTKIALKINQLTTILNNELKKIGFAVENKFFFDTLTIKASPDKIKLLHQLSREAEINFRSFSSGDKLGISLDETCTLADVLLLVNIFRKANQENHLVIGDLEAGLSEDDIENEVSIAKGLKRESDYLTHPIFNSIKSETQMLRYLNYLEKKDLSLNTSMIPLGSCTMKLNAAAQMMPVSWAAFSSLHPFSPLEQVVGYQEVFKELERSLETITGMDKCSLQPNSGAQGEYAGLLAIKKYFEHKGEHQRDIVLIPSSAHGTNPASAVLAGLKVVVIHCLENGDIDLEYLKQKAEENSKELAGLMITYPSTHGVFEQNIKEICQVIHDNGGQVYMDGANLNAQVGHVKAGEIGADVCHINLHKTFAIPHGGGGPGMGPIVVKKHLVSFLPGHPIHSIEGREENTVSAAPWGSASILLISLGYIKLLGESGVKKATEYAILNSNYIRARLEDHYTVLFKARNGLVAHELIIDVRPFLKEANIQAEDIAKRLMDYGFHAPTMSWPVVNTLMIEPTESEDKAELDRFCDAMISIRKEIEHIIQGKLPKENNPLKNAPHSIDYIAQGKEMPYSTDVAFFPLPYVRKQKFWPSVARIDNVHGDRNFYCTCPPMDSY